MRHSKGHAFTVNLRTEAVAEKAIVSFHLLCLLKWQLHKVLFVNSIAVI